MTQPHADFRSVAPAPTRAGDPSAPRPLRGCLSVCGQRVPIDVEHDDDARLRVTLCFWGSPGEIAWLRVWHDAGPADYPCRVQRCRRLPAGAAPGDARTPAKEPAPEKATAAARYTWTLRPLGTPLLA